MLATYFTNTYETHSTKSLTPPSTLEALLPMIVNFAKKSRRIGSSSRAGPLGLGVLKRDFHPVAI